MKSVRLAAILVVIVVSIAALWRLGHKSGDAVAPELVGTWSDDRQYVTLRPDGGYWSAVAGSNGMLAPTECGRWSATDGVLHMRATWQAAPTGAGDTLRLAQPGLHLGSWAGGSPSELTLYTAVAAKDARSRRSGATLRRSTTPVSGSMPVPDRHALESACGMHLPD